jgi:serine/threonine-protein kinase
MRMAVRCNTSIILPEAGRTVLNHRYLLLDRVGAGGAATVYLAQDLTLHREVAVKILYDVFAGDEAVLERFRREASIAESFRHQNIVRALDHGVCDDTHAHYITMEHVPGNALNAVVANEAPMEPARAIAITLQILEATRFIHDHGVIHRDLKAANVLVDPDGLVKVTDFGVASLGAPEITETGSLLGTVEYLSPERLTGESATQASDLYSIGIILYELLTGSVPFTGELVPTVALRHLEEAPLPPACVNSAITPELNAVVIRSLEKAPQARFCEARSFIAALRREVGRRDVAAASAGAI